MKIIDIKENREGFDKITKLLSILRRDNFFTIVSLSKNKDFNNRRFNAELGIFLKRHKYKFFKKPKKSFKAKKGLEKIKNIINKLFK